MTVLKTHGPKKGLKPLGMTKKYLETLEKMVNVQVIPVLIWTVPEPLVNAMNFQYSIAEMVNLLVHLKIFPDNLVQRARVTQSQMQVECFSETLGQEKKVAGIPPEILMVLKFFFRYTQSYSTLGRE